MSFHSVGLYRKDQKEQASAMADRMVAEGKLDVYIEILWTSEYNARVLGPYTGFYVNYREEG